MLAESLAGHCFRMISSLRQSSPGRRHRHQIGGAASLDRLIMSVFILLSLVFGTNAMRAAETSAAASGSSTDHILQQELKQQQVRSTTQRVGEQLASIIAEFDRNGISGEDVKVLRA